MLLRAGHTPLGPRPTTAPGGPANRNRATPATGGQPHRERPAERLDRVWPDVGPRRNRLAAAYRPRPPLFIAPGIEPHPTRGGQPRGERPAEHLDRVWPDTRSLHMTSRASNCGLGADRRRGDARSGSNQSDQDDNLDSHLAHDTRDGSTGEVPAWPRPRTRPSSPTAASGPRRPALPQPCARRSPGARRFPPARRWPSAPHA